MRQGLYHTQVGIITEEEVLSTARLGVHVTWSHISSEPGTTQKCHSCEVEE